MPLPTALRRSACPLQNGPRDTAQNPSSIQGGIEAVNRVAGVPSWLIWGKLSEPLVSNSVGSSSNKRKLLRLLLTTWEEMEGIVTDLPKKSAICCWFTCFVQSLWSWESIHHFATQQAVVVVSQSSQVTAPGCSSLLSWPLQLAVLAKDESYSLSQGCRNGWAQRNSGCLIWICPTHSLQCRILPTAGFHLLNHSPCFMFMFLLHVHVLLKLVPGYWTKIILCDLIAQRQTCDRQNRWRRIDLFLWQTSSWCLIINSIIRANRSVVPTSTHFLSDTRACDGGEWLYRGRSR